MAMPQELVLVRHGLSEINMVTRAEKDGVLLPETNLVYGRHDFEQRLSPEGVMQADKAREWMVENGIAPEDFDGQYVSPYYRTLETAAHLGDAACGWLAELNIIERSWGRFGSTPAEERAKRFADTIREKDTSSFFTRLDGGESIADAVLRFRAFMDTLSRDSGDKRVVAVTHGELMWAARFVIERMLPQEWQDLDSDKANTIRNCNILHYSRVDPDDPTNIAPSLSSGWRRQVDPIEPECSPYGGEWQKLPGKRHFTAEQMLELVTTVPRLIGDKALAGVLLEDTKVPEAPGIEPAD